MGPKHAPAASTTHYTVVLVVKIYRHVGHYGTIQCNVLKTSRNHAFNTHVIGKRHGCRTRIGCRRKRNYRFLVSPHIICIFYRRFTFMLASLVRHHYFTPVHLICLVLVRSLREAAGVEHRAQYSQ